MTTSTPTTTAEAPRERPARRVWDLTALTGALFVLGVVGAFIVAGNTPHGDASAEAVIAHYSANRTQGIVASIVGALAAIPALAFAAKFRERARIALGGSTLANFAFAAGVVTAVGFLAMSASHLALSDYARDLEPSAAQALNALDADSFILLTTGLATFVLAGSLIAIRSRLLPTGLGWIGMPVAIATFTPVGFFAACIAGAWIIVASLLLYANGEPAARVVDPEPFEPDGESGGGAGATGLRPRLGS